MPTERALVASALLAGASSVMCAVAVATPPTAGRAASRGVEPASDTASDTAKAGKSDTAVGRVRMRGQVYDLTPQSLSAEGELGDLEHGFALPVHADVVPDLRKQRPQR